MNEMKADVAVIGAGSAGLVAYRAACGAGRRVLLIEGGAYGTTCARVGCMPSKLLIAAADAAHACVRAASFGVHGGAVRVDGAAVMARLHAERDRFLAFVFDELAQIPTADKLRGHARFIGPNRLQVDDHTRVEARAVVIATGSSPAVPPLLKKAGTRLLTSDGLFEWTSLPASLAVAGVGAIGLELGQALHRLGVRTTLIGRSEQLGGVRDPEVLAAARTILGAELDLRLRTEISDIEADAAGLILHLRDASGASSSLRCDYLLAATGRQPNLDGLELERAGLALDRHGVPLFDPRTMQCGDAPVFLAGDAGGERELLHEAADTGRIAGRNAAHFPAVRPGLRRSPLAITFSDPQMAGIGLPFSQLPADHVCGAVSFENQGRSRVAQENRGLLRVYADAHDGRLLGAELCAPRGEHLAHLLAWAHQNRMTLDALFDMPFYHPTFEEGLRTALREARRVLSGGLPEGEACMRSTPGV